MAGAVMGLPEAIPGVAVPDDRRRIMMIAVEDHLYLPSRSRHRRDRAGMPAPEGKPAGCPDAYPDARRPLRKAQKGAVRSHGGL